MLRPAILAVTAVAALSGCYRPDLQPCAVACTTSCPGDLECRDGFCHEPGSTRTCPATTDAADGADGGDGAMADAATPWSGLERISAGHEHACAIDGDGTLWCWGSNEYRALAAGDLRRSPVPVPVPVPVTDGSAWTQVSAGRGHTCALAGSTAFCWGNNASSQCGRNTGDEVATPMSMAGTWSQVSAGASFTCGVHVDGAARTIRCWGSGDAGRLGTGDDELHATPQVVAGGFIDWDQVTTGVDHACGLRSGALYCWGNNPHGQLGRDPADTSSTRVPGPIAPTAVTAWTAVAAGEGFTCAIGDGALWCWGNNDEGQLGRGGDPRVPVRVDGTGTWTAVTAGTSGACGMRDGAVVCWGNNDEGQLGNGMFEGDLAAPAVVIGLTGATAVSRGGFFACALDASRTARCWGDNAQGQLGDGTVATKWSPAPVGAPTGWLHVSAGRFHTCAVRDDGGSRDVYCWGRADRGQLGVAGDDARLSPFALGLSGAQSVAAGIDHTCAIRDGQATGEMWCWGDNGLGQVGQVSEEQGRIAPVRVGPAGGGFTQVVASDQATCALRGGERWCWGLNGGADDAQLGVPSPPEALRTPAALTDGVAAWRSLGFGRQFGCGVTPTGQLACWGSDRDGRRGDGPGTPGPAPTVIASGYQRVGAGVLARHACAIREADGALRCWGVNDDRQLGAGGDGADAPQAIGSPVVGWTDVAGGGRHTCGIAGGDLHCWGSNDDGALGVDGADGGAALRHVAPGTAWRQVAAGELHTCAISTGGALHCWGKNTHGQLGDGTGARPVPTLVVAPP